MNKQVKKVVILAAGNGTRFLPLTRVIPKELMPILNKPIIQHLVNEVVEAGIKEIILVININKMDILKYFDPSKKLEDKLIKNKKVQWTYKSKYISEEIKINALIQEEQLGAGHAINVAARITGYEPFGVILGDDLINAKVPAIKQLISEYNKSGKSILGVKEVEKEYTHKYGIVTPKINSVDKVFEITGAIEKPKDSKYNIAILGRYVFTPLTQKLFKKTKSIDGKEINIIDIFDTLIKKEGILALKFDGERYDLGSPEGFVKANISYSLNDNKIKNNIKKFIDGIK